MIQIIAVPIEPLTKSEGITSAQWNTLMSALPVDKQQRIHRFIHKKDALRTLIADILSRWMICCELNIKNREIQFTTNEYGKPLLQHYDKLHYNQSHSGNWVVSALDYAPIGIDVEEIGQEADLDIAEHFFSEQECRDLFALKASEQRDYFFDLWTLKESYIKAVGSGLSLPLDSFTIRRDHRTRSFALDVAHCTNVDFHPCHFRQYPLDPDYKLSVCAKSDSFPVQPQILHFDELYRYFLGIL